ncbi:MAG: hypothetical protein J7521_19060 [Caulobacter sp.]|nr:hypothetical protein [Caulobacter sp.]
MVFRALEQTAVSSKWILALVMSLGVGGIGLAAEAAHVVTAHEVAAHKARMDAAEELKLDLQDALDAHDAKAFSAPTRKLLPLLRQEQAYWRKTGVAEAIALGEQNGQAADALLVHADAGDFEAASTAYGDLLRSCAACHDAHPEAQVQVAQQPTRTRPAGTGRAGG